MEFSSGGGAGSGGNDVELLSKTLQVEHKLFYFDLKENPRGRYLKISEKTSATRSTIIVPFNGIAWFFDIFNYYVSSDDQDVSSKELQLDSKVFYFDIGENRRGQFLKVSEASVSRNRGTIIVPAGSNRDEGWTAFRNILEEINETSKLFVSPNQQNSKVCGKFLIMQLCLLARREARTHNRIWMENLRDEPFVIEDYAISYLAARKRRLSSYAWIRFELLEARLGKKW